MNNYPDSRSLESIKNLAKRQKSGRKKYGRSFSSYT